MSLIVTKCFPVVGLCVSWLQVARCPGGRIGGALPGIVGEVLGHVEVHGHVVRVGCPRLPLHPSGPFLCSSRHPLGLGPSSRATTAAILQPSRAPRRRPAWPPAPPPCRRGWSRPAPRPQWGGAGVGARALHSLHPRGLGRADVKAEVQRWR